MVHERRHIDISNMPDLLQIVEEVSRTKEPALLRRNHEDLAVLTPAPGRAAHRARRTPTAADFAAFRASAGSWKGIVDTEKLVADVYESRRLSSRPPVEL